MKVINFTHNSQVGGICLISCSEACSVCLQLRFLLCSAVLAVHATQLVYEQIWLLINKLNAVSIHSSFFISVWLWISKQIQFCCCFLKCGHKVSMSDVSQTCESRFVYVPATLSHSYGLFKIQCRLRKLQICYFRWGNSGGLNKDWFFSLVWVVNFH